MGCQAEFWQCPSRLVCFGRVHVVCADLSCPIVECGAAGRDLRVKQLKIQEVERENAQLRYEIAALASPSAIEQRGTQIGTDPPSVWCMRTCPGLSRA